LYITEKPLAVFIATARGFVIEVLTATQVLHLS